MVVGSVKVIFLMRRDMKRNQLKRKESKEGKSRELWLTAKHQIYIQKIFFAGRSVPHYPQTLLALKVLQRDRFGVMCVVEF